MEFRLIFSRRNLVAWGVLGLMLLMTLVIWNSLHQRMDVYARQQFDLLIKQVTEAITLRMREHEQILRGAAGLFDASVEVDRQEWHAYVSRLNLPRHYPGIQGLGFTKVLQPDEVPGHVAGIRTEGFPDYALHPAGIRPLYSAIIYLEPFTGRNLAAFGFDMLSENSRKQAMMAAAESGETRMTGKVRLVQETHGNLQAGLLIYLPIYHKHQPLDSPEARKAALMGFVYSPYRMDDLMGAILGSAELELDFDIYAGKQMLDAARLYTTRRDLGEQHAPQLSATQVLDLYGQSWTLQLDSRPEFESRFYASSSQLKLNELLVLSLGGSIGCLLFAVISIQHFRREQAEQLAASMTKDIRSANQALRESEERLSLVLKGSNDGWWDYDLQRNTLFYSPRWWEMLGYQPDELPADPQLWERLLPPELHASTLENFHRLIRSDKTACSMEFRLRHKDGHYVPVQVRGYILRNEAGEALRISASNLDLTERKHIERMKSEFVSTVSHELRTPLASVSSSLAVVLRGVLGEVPPTIAPIIKIAQDNCLLLSQTLNDLLDMDALLAGNLRFNLQAQLVMPVVDQALESNRVYAEQYRVHYKLVSRADSAFARIDDLRLQQVLGNLLSNAARFSPPGCQVEVGVRILDGRVRISVTDIGSGVSVAARARLFKTFSQVNEPDFGQKEGSGLGLAISKHLIEHMGGEIGYDATGPGACFYLELPQMPR